MPADPAKIAESPDAGVAPARQRSLLQRLVGIIAVAGGCVSVATAAVVVLSVFGRWFKSSSLASLAPWIGPIDGDFEYVKMGTAIAIFAFLPYTQALRSNIFVDTFTSRLPQRTQNALDAFWDFVYAAMMAVLTGAMVFGTMDYYQSGETTMMLQLPVWPAILVCTLLSGLLTVVTVVTAVRLLRGVS